MIKGNYYLTQTSLTKNVQYWNTSTTPYLYNCGLFIGFTICASVSLVTNTNITVREIFASTMYTWGRHTFIYIYNIQLDYNRRILKNNTREKHRYLNHYATRVSIVSTIFYFAELNHLMLFSCVIHTRSTICSSVSLVTSTSITVWMIFARTLCTWGRRTIIYIYNIQFNYNRRVRIKRRYVA